VAAVGYPEGAALISVAAGGAGAEFAVPGVGACPATTVALEHPPGGILVLARSGSDGLSGEEASLLRGMARVTSLTMRMLRLLDDERAAHEESDHQAAENARLLGTLSEHTGMLERLAEEQAALRRVATLVAGQAAADEIFTAVAEEVARLFRAEIGGIARYDPDESLTMIAEWDDGSGGLPMGTRVGLEHERELVTSLPAGRPHRITYYEGFSTPIVALARKLGIHTLILVLCEFGIKDIDYSPKRLDPHLHRCRFVEQHGLLTDPFRLTVSALQAHHNQQSQKRGKEKERLPHPTLPAAPRCARSTNSSPVSSPPNPLARNRPTTNTKIPEGQR